MEEIPQEIMDGLPPAVQREMKEAEEMTNTLQQATETAPLTEVEDLNVSTEQQQETQFQPQEGIQSEFAPQVEPQPAPQQQQVETPDERYQALEHRFSVMEGKFKAEVPELHQQLRAEREEKARLQAQLEAMRTPEPPPEPKSRMEMYGLDESEAEFGEELLSTTEKVVDHRVGEINKAFDQKLSRIEERLTEQSRQRFAVELDREVPGWRKLYDQTAFTNWADDFDPMRGMTRQEMLNDAARQFDAQRVKMILSEYRKGNGGAVPAVQKTSVESQVMPAQTVATQNPRPAASTQKKTYTRQEYDTAMDRLALMVVEHPVEADKIRNELESALAEGRITGII